MLLLNLTPEPLGSNFTISPERLLTLRFSRYTGLEAKVAERTQELELSKKAAEAANESKTLFIANISHELKTPLNGILGMCAVCLGMSFLYVYPRISIFQIS